MLHTTSFNDFGGKDRGKGGGGGGGGGKRQGGMRNEAQMTR